MDTKKTIPLWYFFISLLLISYGWFSIFIQKNSTDYNLLNILNFINLGITFFWIIFNMIFISIIIKNKFNYYKEEMIFPFYYLILNLINVGLIYFTFLKGYFHISFEFFFYSSLGTKIFESILIPYIIWKKLKK